jgi:hypothetical protein
MENAVAADALVHHAQHAAAAPRHEPPCKLVRPAVVGIELREVAVGQRVAEGHDPSGLPRREQLDAAHEKEGLRGLLDRHDGRRGEIAGRRNVVGLVRVTVPSDLEAFRHIVRQMDAHCKVRKGRHLELDRIAYDERTGGDRGGRRPVEGKRAARSRDDSRAFAPQRDVRGGDGELARPVSIRQAHPQASAADAEMCDHPQRLIGECYAFHRRRRRGPGANPMHVVLLGQGGSSSFPEVALRANRSAPIRLPVARSGQHSRCAQSSKELMLSCIPAA